MDTITLPCTKILGLVLVNIAKFQGLRKEFKLAPIVITQVQLDCEYPPVCADGTTTEEGYRNSEEMGMLWGHSPNSDVVGGNRDLTRVLLSPRVVSTNNPSHPMSRRSLSQKRMQEPSPYLLLKLCKGQRAHEGEESPNESISKAEMDDGGSGKDCRKDRCYISRFGDNTVSQYFGGPKNWRQSAFYFSTLLIITFFLLKITYVGIFSVHNRTSDVLRVIFDVASW